MESQFGKPRRTMAGALAAGMLLAGVALAGAPAVTAAE
jgi:carbohydrate-selective porin OprB